MYCSLPNPQLANSLIDLRKSPYAENEEYREYLSNIAKARKLKSAPERSIMKKEPIHNVKTSKRIQPKNFQSRKRKHFANKKICALIATFQGQCSYDRLYNDIPQMPPDESLYYISVYSILYEDIPLLIALLTQSESAMKTTNENQGVSGEKKIEKESKVEAYKDSPSYPILHEMIDEMQKLDGKSIIFNWECSSSCSKNQFPNNITSSLFQLLKLLLARKCLCIFADYSLKALIHNWNEEVLGKNPFYNIGVSGGDDVILFFNSEKLIQSPSLQLQRVGQLSENGKAVVKTLSGTILYTLLPTSPSFDPFSASSSIPSSRWNSRTVYNNNNNNNNRINNQNNDQINDHIKNNNQPSLDHTITHNNNNIKNDNNNINNNNVNTGILPAYELDILTIVLPSETNQYHIDRFPMCRIDYQEGLAGHVLLRYESGGMLLTSGTHWVDLIHLENFSIKSILLLTAKQYGKQYSDELQAQLSSYTASQLHDRLRTLSTFFVQSAIPGQYSL